MSWARLRALQPPLVLRPHPFGLGQEVTHVFPDGGVQDISAELLIPAKPLATEAIGVGARTAVVGVGNLALGRGPAHRLAVAAVAAPLAHYQALKEISAATGLFATTLPVLLKLSLNRLEEFLAHQPGNVDGDLLFRRCIDPRDRTPGLLRTATLRAQALRLEGAARVLPKPAVPL